METIGDQCDYVLSMLVAGSIGAESFRCWRNAALAVMCLPNLFAAGFYVEGWIVLPRQSRIAIVEHGWTTIPDLLIIDPTMVLMEKPSQPVSYFPGYVLSREQLSELLSGSIVPLVRHTAYGDDGMKHSGYRAAYEQAWETARALAQEMQLQETAIQVSARDSRRGLTIIME